MGSWNVGIEETKPGPLGRVRDRKEERGNRKEEKKLRIYTNKLKDFEK
jgi:hypothetical protein